MPAIARPINAGITMLEIIFMAQSLTNKATSTSIRKPKMIFTKIIISTENN
jgi:hypothetical protein